MRRANRRQHGLISSRSFFRPHISAKQRGELAAWVLAMRVPIREAGLRPIVGTGYFALPCCNQQVRLRGLSFLFWVIAFGAAWVRGGQGDWPPANMGTCGLPLLPPSVARILRKGPSLMLLAGRPRCIDGPCVYPTCRPLLWAACLAKQV